MKRMSVTSVVSVVMFIPICFQVTIILCVRSMNPKDFLCGASASAMFRDNDKMYLRQKPCMISTTETTAASTGNSTTTNTTNATNTTNTTNTTTSSVNVPQEQQPFKVSLWLIPPPDVNDKLQLEIDRLAFLHSPESSGISFAPHVTVVGGILVHSSKEVDEMIQMLRDGLKGFGGIDCEFDTQLVFETKHNEQDGQTVVWNQAAAATMHITPAFLRLCQTARTLLGMENMECMFPPPILQPHMSLYYGRDGVPSQTDVIEPVPAFTADRVALWKTWPSDNEQGVLQWRELARISLM